MKRISSLTILLSLFALPLSAQDRNYQMAVVENSIGAKEIKSGDYAEGIDVINNAMFVEDAHLIVAAQMNLCVAYTNLGEWQLATTACDKAVDMSQSLSKQKSDRLNKRLASVALSNRGVSRIKQNKFMLAKKDLNQAHKVQENPITQTNLIAFAQQILSEDADS